MSEEELLERFENDYGYLISLGAKIKGVYETRDSGKINDLPCDLVKKIENGQVFPEQHEISVTHPFLFDNRLIPEEYLGFTISNSIEIGNNYEGKYILNYWPKEFDDDEDDDEKDGAKYLYDLFAHERFVDFVDRCAPLIRLALDQPEMTKKEMLDALAFGDFEAHKKENEEKRRSNL